MRSSLPPSLCRSVVDHGAVDRLLLQQPHQARPPHFQSSLRGIRELLQPDRDAVRRGQPLRRHEARQVPVISHRAGGHAAMQDPADAAADPFPPHVRSLRIFLHQPALARERAAIIGEPQSECDFLVGSSFDASDPSWR